MIIPKIQIKQDITSKNTKKFWRPTHDSKQTESYPLFPSTWSALSL